MLIFKLFCIFDKNNCLKHFLLFFLTLLLFNLPIEGQAKLPPNTTPFSQPDFRLYLEAGSLHIKGMEGNGTIQIYSIIGNLIHLFEVRDFKNFEMPVDLENKQMYIIRIETKDFKKTVKIVNS